MSLAAWQIEHACPQCGAPVTLEETDLVLACPYCRVRYYIVSQEADHLYLAPADPDSPDLFYAPYWRFKGTVLSCVNLEIEDRFLDSTVRAVRLEALPLSLGLRPQAMKLKYLSDQTPGRILEAELSFDEALARIEDNIARMGGLSREAYHRVFFGETASLIYAPFYLAQGRVVDAVSLTQLGALPETPNIRDLPESTRSAWEVKFIPAICPSCGWDLEGGKNTQVLACGNCKSVWTASGSGLSRLDYGVMPSKETPAVYLPFWRMKTRVEGIRLSSYADLIRMANLPRAVKKEWEDRELYFWTPAFKVQAKLYRRLARNMTAAQPREDFGLDPARASLAGVTLPVTEAAESLKTVLAGLSAAKRKLFPRLPEINITLREYFLVYFPFFPLGREVVNSELQLSVGREALGLSP